jgi:hypothetical protein
MDKLPIKKRRQIFAMLCEGSPAMAAGITDRLWSLDDAIAKIDELVPAPKSRGPYKKRVA